MICCVCESQWEVEDGRCAERRPPSVARVTQRSGSPQMVHTTRQTQPSGTQGMPTDHASPAKWHLPTTSVTNSQQQNSCPSLATSFLSILWSRNHAPVLEDFITFCDNQWVWSNFASIGYSLLSLSFFLQLFLSVLCILDHEHTCQVSFYLWDSRIFTPSNIE